MLDYVLAAIGILLILIFGVFWKRPTSPTDRTLTTVRWLSPLASVIAALMVFGLNVVHVFEGKRK
jgi:uncharacterized integral membrane protein